MKRLFRWCWIWACVFCRNFGRCNDYYWPDRRAWCGCDGVRYGDAPMFHRHRWQESRLNPYGMTTEEKCRCGAYRHHLAVDLDGVECGDEPRWRTGRHPANAALTAGEAVPSNGVVGRGV